MKVENFVNVQSGVDFFVDKFTDPVENFVNVQSGVNFLMDKFTDPNQK